MNIVDIGTLIVVIVPFVFAIIGYSLAKKRNRNGWVWFFNCWMTGLIGLLVLFMIRPLEGNAELVDCSKNDIFGYAYFFFSIIFVALLIWYAWQAFSERGYYNLVM
ncbi:MAG: hypothetical protein Q4D56_12750 [Bacteroides sp.]|nr:hypothetical protein [Bacteroides sp.]